jgi:hypothetical protein
MSKIASYVLELLSEDMVSHGLLVQSVEQENVQLDWKDVLKELLSQDVEIGEARLASPTYVEFIAWRGPIEERVSRAVNRLESLTGPDREFAYWLALRKNVDRFEAEEA